MLACLAACFFGNVRAQAAFAALGAHLEPLPHRRAFEARASGVSYYLRFDFFYTFYPSSAVSSPHGAILLRKGPVVTERCPQCMPAQYACHHRMVRYACLRNVSSPHGAMQRLHPRAMQLLFRWLSARLHTSAADDCCCKTPFVPQCCTSMYHSCSCCATAVSRAETAYAAVN